MASVFHSSEKICLRDQFQMAVSDGHFLFEYWELILLRFQKYSYLRFSTTIF